MSTEALYVLLVIAGAMLLGMLAGLRSVRRFDAPVELYQPGDAWAAKGRRGR